ncbi:hypothetical protein [Halalkalibacterium ligniniphilum]|uniref:hypothetical protein n=1 Tax=Halalkalibacterium ligniniphilum TaxID=1134413 RepID=UPI0003451321|nr:hypothetical protein [Halalkalibacterium ligniniphilum]
MIIYLYSSLVGLFFISLFLSNIWLEYAIGTIVFLSIVLSFPKAKRLYKITGGLFLLVGLLLYFQTESRIIDIPLSMTSTVVLIAMFVVLPFINSIIVIGRYDRTMNKLLTVNVTNLGSFFGRTASVSYLIGMFLNIGTLPFVYQVVFSNMKELSKTLRDTFISQAMLRGYALCLVWSPMEILVAMSIDITGASYLSLLPWLLSFSFFLLLITWLNGRKYKKYPFSLEQDTVDLVKVFRKITVLLCYLILFIVVIILTGEFFELSFLETVALIIIPYSFFWALMIRRIRSYLTFGINAWKQRVSNLQNYVVLFLAVGFFIQSLNNTVYMDILQVPFLLLMEYPIAVFLFIQLLFLGLAMVGFHPLVTMSIIGELIQPMLGTIPPISIAIVLIIAGLSTVMAGPFNISVSITGLLTNRNPYQISLWNLGFAFMFSSLGTGMAYLMYVLYG